MTIDDIDVIHVEALEGGLCALNDVFPGETLVVRSRAAPEDLGGDDDIGSLPTELSDGLSHDLLSAAIGVNLSVVEEIDAIVTAALQ